ncbi:MAG: hypothetical protein RL518_1757 [Pseudomonadota bacterium]|jgi:hypothetical protein
MSLGILASLVLSLFVMWYVLGPLFESGPLDYGASAEPAALGPLLDAKERALRSLKDLEMDFSMGKLSQDDFDQSKRSLTAEVASILAEIQKHGGEG